MIVGAGASVPFVAVVPPNSVVPLPASPRTRSVTGRPARTSMLVTIASTASKTPTATSAARRQVATGAGAERAGSVGGSPSTTVGDPGSARGPNRAADGTTTRTRSRVERNDCPYTALPTAVATLAMAAPMIVLLTPR